MDSAAAPQPPKPSPPPPSARPGSTKRISPLNDTQTEACLQAIREFRAGLSQALLYTPGTVQFEKVCDSTFAALTTAVEAIGDFKLGLLKAQVLVNGERMETPVGLRGQIEYVEKVVAAAGTASVTFHKGLTRGEVGPFLQLLARKQLPHIEGAKVNEFLREQGIQHLDVDELRYVEVKGNERVVSGEGQVLSNHAVAHDAVTELVDAALASIEKVEDEEARIQLRAEVADQFIEKSQAMLPNLLATATQRLKTEASDEQVALAAVPPRDGQLLNKALEAARLLPATGAEEAREALRVLIEQLSRPYQARAEDLLAHAQLEGADQRLLPDWLQQARAPLQGMSAVDRLGGILCQSPGTLLSEQMFPHIVDVLDELSVAGMDAEAGQLAGHVAGALRVSTKRERGKAAERVSFLLERLMDQSSPAARTMEDALLQACMHETSDEVLKVLVEHLSKRCVHHYRLHNWTRAAEHLEWITSLEESQRLALRAEGANIARQGREALAKTPFAQELSGELLAEGEQGTVVVRMLQVLGATVWRGAVERLRSETDAARAQRLATRLREISPEAARLVCIELGREPDGPTVLRLLALAPALQDDAGLWGALQSLMHHADQQVRERAFAMVIARDDGLAAEALVGALRSEGEPERRKIWVRALARMRNPAAEQALLDELNRAVAAAPPNETLLLPILEVLSAAGHRGIIPPALSLLRHHGHTLIHAGTPLPPRPLVLAAIRALAPFYRDSQVAETLERLRKDKDAEVARLALVCLRGIVAAEHQQAAQEPAPAPEKPAVPSITAASVPAPRKTYRGFEILEASAQAAAQFRTGAGIGGPARPEAPGETAPLPCAPAAPGAAGGEPDLDALKPTVEGFLDDLGLAATARMVGGKDGVLRACGPALEGRVYIKGRKIIHASCGAKSGLAALADIDAARKMPFSYHPGVFPVPVTVDLDPSQLQEALRKHRGAP